MHLQLKYFICLLLCTQLAGAQSRDTLSAKSDHYSFIGMMPSFSGILTFGQPQSYANVFIPGLSLSCGKSWNKWILGAAISYRHYFIKNLKDANEYTIGPFLEYHFRPEQKASWVVGLKPYLLIWQYSPQSESFRFFNDPLDGKSRTYVIPTVFPYVGGNFKIKKKYHLVVGAGYDFKLRTRSGVVPFGMIFDFRIPIRKSKGRQETIR